MFNTGECVMERPDPAFCLVMTAEQGKLFAAKEAANKNQITKTKSAVKQIYTNIPVIKADQQELQAHHQYLEKLSKSSGDECVWLKNPEHTQETTE